MSGQICLVQCASQNSRIYSSAVSFSGLFPPNQGGPGISPGINMNSFCVQYRK